MIQRYASRLLILAGETVVVCSGMQVEPQEKADDHNGNNRQERASLAETCNQLPDSIHGPTGDFGANVTVL
jgi:hypothetical protein